MSQSLCIVLVLVTCGALAAQNEEPRVKKTLVFLPFLVALSALSAAADDTLVK